MATIQAKYPVCGGTKVIKRGIGGKCRVLSFPKPISAGYDKHLYKSRHLVENAFLALQRWRSIAIRYAKNTASFIAAVQIRWIATWLGAL